MALSVFKSPCTSERNFTEANLSKISLERHFPVAPSKKRKPSDREWEITMVLMLSCNSTTRKTTKHNCYKRCWKIEWNCCHCWLKAIGNQQALLVSATERNLQALITWFTEGCHYSRGGGGVGVVGETLPPVNLKHVARKKQKTHWKGVKYCPLIRSGHVAGN